jgi:hypothetical protein
MNIEIKNKMDWSKQYTYKEKTIYISYETDTYILCSFNEDLTAKFKLDKSAFNL